MKNTADLLAFDVGTSSCKAAIFSEQGELLATGRGAYNVYHRNDVCVEQDPEEIFTGVQFALDAIRRQGFDLASIRAIGISSQMAAHCLIGCEDKPITPILSWMDQRARAEVDSFNLAFTQAEAKRLMGMDIKMTPAHTVIRLKWLNAHHRELLEKAKYFVQVKDLLVQELTGCWVSDVTTLKGLVDQKSGAIIPEMLKFTGCQADILLPAKMPYEEAGKLLPGIEGFEDLIPGIPVVVGWNDMNAAFLGMGGMSGQCAGMDLTGTSEHLGISSSRIPQDYLTCGLNSVPFLREKNVCYGVTSAGGQAFDWYMKQIYSNETDDPYARLMDKITNIEPNSIGNLLFIPYIEGERNPWIIDRGNGMFMCLSGENTKEDMAIAVMEGVCFELRSILERMPIQPMEIVVSGGAARNDFWNQMKADVMGIPYKRLYTTEAGCNGAAILAKSVLEPDRDITDIASEMTHSVKCYEPRTTYHDYYDEKYHMFLNVLEQLILKAGRSFK